MKNKEFKDQVDYLRKIAFEYRNKITSIERKIEISTILNSFGALNLNTGNGQFVIAI